MKCTSVLPFQKCLNLVQIYKTTTLIIKESCLKVYIFYYSLASVISLPKDVLVNPVSLMS